MEQDLGRPWSGCVGHDFHRAAARTRKTISSGKFMRCVIGTNHIDNCARVCHSATVTGMMETRRVGREFLDPRSDLAKLILVVGANPTESHPVLGAHQTGAVRNGVPLIVIDPRRNGTGSAR